MPASSGEWVGRSAYQSLLPASGSVRVTDGYIAEMLWTKQQSYQTLDKSNSGMEVFSWTQATKSNYLYGTSAQEVNEWVDAIAMYLGNLTNLAEVPDVLQLESQMLYRVHVPGPAHDVLNRILPIIKEIVEQRVATVYKPAVRAYVSEPLGPAAAARFFVWLVREGRMLFFKPVSSDAIRAYRNFSVLRGDGSLAYREPVALLSDLERVWRAISDERPKESKVVERACEFLDILMGPHTITGTNDVRDGMGTQLRKYFDSMHGPARTWANLSEHTMKLWEQLQGRHIEGSVMFSSGLFAERPKRTGSAERTGRVAANANVLDAGTAFANLVAVAGQKLKCPHCSATGHVGSTCWHFNPALAPEDWVPRTELGYELWVKRRVMLGLPKGAPFLTKQQRTEIQDKAKAATVATRIQKLTGQEQSKPKSRSATPTPLRAGTPTPKDQKAHAVGTRGGDHLTKNKNLQTGLDKAGKQLGIHCVGVDEEDDESTYGGVSMAGVEGLVGAMDKLTMALKQKAEPVQDDLNWFPRSGPGSVQSWSPWSQAPSTPCYQPMPYGGGARDRGPIGPPRPPEAPSSRGPQMPGVQAGGGRDGWRGPVDGRR